MPLLWYLIIGVLLDLAAGQITGTGSVAGVAIGVGTDLLWWLVGLGEINAVRRFAFDLAINELEKAAHEASQQHEEDDEETDRRTRKLARENPNTTYIYGEVSVEDLAIFGVAGTVAAVPAISEYPFEVATGLLLDLTGFYY